MIHESAHTLERIDFKIIKPLRDMDGTVGYWLRRDDEDFVLVAKEYSYRGLASFMETLVKRAADLEMTLVFYEDTSHRFTVFDSAYYAQHGAVSTGMSKTRDTRWLELPLDDGVSLEDYLEGRARPTTLAGNNATLAGFQ